MFYLRCLGHGEEGLLLMRVMMFDLDVVTLNPGVVLLQPSGENVGLSWLHPSVPDTQTRHYFSSPVSNRDTNFVAIHRMFKFFLQIRLKDPYERPNLPAISKIVLRGLR
jgi:hypothetical protein